jgi:6-phosphogluconate dehydrogenase
LEQALYACKIISYTQGFMLMRETAKELDWHLNYASIARIWRGGCIIKVRTGTPLFSSSDLLIVS